MTKRDYAETVKQHLQQNGYRDVRVAVSGLLEYRASVRCKDSGGHRRNLQVTLRQRGKKQTVQIRDMDAPDFLDELEVLDAILDD